MSRLSHNDPRWTRLSVMGDLVTAFDRVPVSRMWCGILLVRCWHAPGVIGGRARNLVLRSAKADGIPTALVPWLGVGAYEWATYPPGEPEGWTAANLSWADTARSIEIMRAARARVADAEDGAVVSAPSTLRTAMWSAFADMRAL